MAVGVVEPVALEADPSPGTTIALAAALTARQAAARDTITARTVAVVATLYRRFSAWYDEAALVSLAWQAAQASRSGQVAAAGASAASMRQALALLGVTTPQVTVRVPEGGLRPVDFLEEWSRPAEAFRFERSRGASPEVALERAVARAGSLADGDISLANREGSRSALAATGPAVTGYRRVIHPELSRGGTCGLCIVASDRLYAKAELLPVHGRDRCEVLPIVDGQDPGTPIAQVKLEELYAAAGSTHGKDLKRVRVQYDSNSELGPVLAPAGSHTRDADQVALVRRGAAAERAKVPGKSSRQVQAELLSRSVPSLERLAAADVPGARQALAARRTRIAELLA